MGVIVESVKFLDPDLSGGQSVTWPFGQIEDRFAVLIDFRVEAFSIDVNDEQEIEARPSVSADVPDTSNLLQADFLAFENFIPLDSIEIIGTASNDGVYTIVEKINEDGLILDSPLANEAFPSGAYIQLVTPIRGIRYRWNWIENNDPTNFISAINGEEMRYDTAFADASSPGVVVMDAKGKNEYKFGDAEISGRGISGGSQRFTILQRGLLLPSFLAGQYEDLKAGILPPYYLDGNCLKHVFEIEANHELADPNRTQTVLYDLLLGNTGGYNESFNGGVTPYSISNKQIQRVSDLEVLDKLDLQETCTVTFDIDHPNNVFTPGTSIAVLKFSYLPSQTAFYNNTGGKNYTECFYADRAAPTVGTTVPGANFGTNEQIIESFAISLINPTKLRCTATINIAVAAQDILLTRDKPQYRLMVTTLDNSLPYGQSDKATLIVDVNEFFVKLIDIDLIKTVGAAFIQHPYNDSSITGPLTALPVDDIVSEQQFFIDFNGITDQGIIIKSVTTEIVAKSPGNPEIILESNVLDTSNFPLIDGYIQEIAAVQDRGYKIPDEIRRKISLSRNSTLDTPTIKNWILQYAFMQRWDEWNEVLAITNPVQGIYDPALPFNGFNNDWLRYTTIAGYQLNARHTFLIEQNGQNFTQTFDFSYDSENFLSNTDWTNELIEILDTSLPMPWFQNMGGGEFFIRGVSNSPVEINFTWAGVGPAPDVADVTMVLWFGLRGENDTLNIYRASSAHNKSENSWIVEDKIAITKTGNDYLGECTLDHTKLPFGKRYVTAYARIYQPIGAPPGITKTVAPFDEIKTTHVPENKTLA